MPLPLINLLHDRNPKDEELHQNCVLRPEPTANRPRLLTLRTRSDPYQSMHQCHRVTCPCLAIRKLLHHENIPVLLFMITITITISAPPSCCTAGQNPPLHVEERSCTKLLLVLVLVRKTRWGLKLKCVIIIVSVIGELEDAGPLPSNGKRHLCDVVCVPISSLGLGPKRDAMACCVYPSISPFFSMIQTRPMESDVGY